MRPSILLAAFLAAAPSLAQRGWNNTSPRPSGPPAISRPPSSAPPRSSVPSSRPPIRTPVSSPRPPVRSPVPSSMPPTPASPSQPPPSTPPTTVTVSNGDTIDVPPGVMVVGGPGGGFFTIGGGAAVPVAAGQSVRAEPKREDPKPSEPSEPQKPTSPQPTTPTPTSPRPASSQPPSSQPPSSQPPVGTPKPYIIFPKDGADTGALITTLEGLVKPQVPRAVDLLDPATNSNSTLMLVANLTDTQFTQVQRDSAVAGLMANAELTAPAPIEAAQGTTVPPPKKKRRSLRHLGKRALVNMETDDYDLIQLSTPTDSQPGTSYDFDESAGRGITVYVIESNIFTGHQEFTDGGRVVRTISVPDMTGGGAQAPDFHGTCAASKAVGNTAGAAPNADFVAVELENDDVPNLIAAFAMVGQDVARRGLRGKAVVSCSMSASEGSITALGITTLNRTLATLVRMDIPIVLSAGNYGGEIDIYPALLADQLPLITVGAVDDKGEVASWSQGGPLLTTAAGGVDIVCATDEGEDAYRMKSGTSFAAPLVAGMVAYWLGHPEYSPAFPETQVAEAAKNSVTSLHWPRVPGGYKVAYNGAHECLATSFANHPPGEDPSPGLGGFLASSCPPAFSPVPSSVMPSSTLIRQVMPTGPVAIGLS